MFASDRTDFRRCLPDDPAAKEEMAARPMPGQHKGSQMSKTHPLGFRIEREIKEALVKAAKDDHRSVSSLVELVIARWLKERGYLGDAKDKAA